MRCGPFIFIALLAVLLSGGTSRPRALSKSTNGTVANFTYKLAAAGNRTNLVETVNGTSRTNVWVYNPLYRLTNETLTATIGGTVSYKYDAVGNRTNRTSSIAGITNQTFVFNSNDQPTNDLFDANGNTRTNSGNTFAYDVENRMTNAVVSGTNIVIVYDGDGNRVKKIVGTTTNLYLVDDLNPSGYAQVLEEKTVSGGTTNLVRLYTYGLDLISQKDTVTAFFGYDGNGSTRYLTATNAAVTDTYVYDAFGVVITNTGTTTNFYRYSGEQYDPNLGFVYLRARYLNPNSGRFISRDTFAGNAYDPASIHKYLYGQNNPIDNIDPSGHDIVTSISVLGGFSILDSFSSGATVAAKSFARSVISRISPRTLYLRAFAPWKKFGGGFGGDDRGFSTSRSVTSRITGIITFTLLPFAIVSQSAYSDPSTHAGFTTKTGTPHITATVLGNTMHIKMWGKNPLIPSPDIDTKVDMKVQTTYIQSLYTGDMYGDAFPNAELFVVDPSGSATMLHIFTTSGGQNTGPADYLPGDNNRPMGSFSKLISND